MSEKSELVARLSVSEITTVQASFEDDLSDYRAAGISGIGLWESKLVSQRSIPEAAARVRDIGLRVTNLVPDGNSVFPTALSRYPTDPGQRVEQLVAHLPAIVAFHPETVIIVTGVDPGAPIDATRRRCVAELRVLAQEAGDLGLTLALEPMHLSAAEDFSFVNSLDDAAALLSEVDEPAIRLMYDTWHMGQYPDSLEQLAKHVGLVGGVQVADAPAAPRGWADRAFPGEGCLPLDALLRVIEADGFDGSYDVEIFSDDGRFGQHFPDSLWDLPSGESLKRATSFLRRWLLSDGRAKKTDHE